MNKLKQNLCCILFAALALPACKDKNDPQPSTQPDQEPAPTANFSFDRKFIEPGDTVYFTNTSELTVNYEWDFGNDSTSTKENPYMVFSELGTYSVKLTASTEAGKRLEKTGTVTVGERYLTQVSASNIPLTKWNGDSWDDDGSGPDIQFRTWPSGAATFLYRSEVYQDLSQPDVTLQFADTIKFTENRWTLIIVDQDSADQFNALSGLTYYPMVEGEINHETGNGIIKTNHGMGIDIEFKLK